ncbi:DNA mismatch repair endonuclease MutL [Pararhodobacter sp.]|uniref:DNA mismatch repair endonuclease MutL n=1 Tax=Pararhodobacter sp. TaxID=2127056 RepID=UPI002AFF8E20|nr:DNA mismatch repair endonuclease MutL [Pararhodobacter sp.]
MQATRPNISQPRAVIRQLDETAANRIAAGEVVERPASAVKELVENALDAGATRIRVDYAGGGKTLIRVSDDGCGMSGADLPLAMSRHATSKIDGSDLLNIHTFGFRGEALPSLGAVGRLTITSRTKDDDGAEIAVTAGKISPVRPAALNTGTTVELRDLFFATPARLKFMRTDRAEAQAIADTLKRLAMAEPYVGFTLTDIDAERTVLQLDSEQGALFDALEARLAQIMGREFTDNALRLNTEREGVRLSGYAALPTYSRGSSVAQYLFVNGRPVRDKMLYGALRAAYADVLARDRHPAAALFIDCDPELVDVNVHPAKAEVHFRDPGIVRGLVVSGIRHALAEAGHRASGTVAAATLGAMRPEPSGPRIWQMDYASRPSFSAMQTAYAAQSPLHDADGVIDYAMAEAPAPFARIEPESGPTDAPLGAARAQVHENYIIAQTSDGIVIVDQHAAHERLVYERLKRQMAERGIAAQALLIPEIVPLSQGDAQRLLEHADSLEKLGLVIEPFGGDAIAVRETPAELGTVNARKLVLDILDELADLGQSGTLGSRLDAVLSRMACHGSIRSGRQMRGEEMNALLREMEATPLSGQCNHGRPTYVELKLSDIEKLFGRR